MNDERISAVQALKTAKGQIEGIINMIENDRYCIDISNQMIAAQSLLKKSNMLVLKQHLNLCLKDALVKGKGDDKIDEIIALLEKMTFK